MMITCKTDIKDRLNNAQMRFVFDFPHKDGKITKTYVKLDDQKVSEVESSNDSYGKRDTATPVTMVEVQSSVKED